MWIYTLFYGMKQALSSTLSPLVYIQQTLLKLTDA